MRPAAALLSGDRLHLQHGPIDLIIGAHGARDLAFQAARARFETVLDELVSELPLLRSPMLPGAPKPYGRIACRMDTACRHFTSGFITRMIAVAGSVADEVLGAMIKAAPLRKAYVNNGGDISVFTSENQDFTTAMQDHQGRELGRITLKHGQNIGGIATSGQRGRSHSLGIADSVTVLASTAAQADVAATLIANAVDLPGHPAITRCAAREIDPDSDLTDMPVVTHCATLAPQDIAKALDAGKNRASALQASGHITSAALFLGDDVRVLGNGFVLITPAIERSTP